MKDDIEIKITRRDLISMIESSLNRDYFSQPHEVKGIALHPQSEDKVATLVVGLPEATEGDSESQVDAFAGPSGDDEKTDPE